MRTVKSITHDQVKKFYTEGRLLCMEGNLSVGRSRTAEVERFANPIPLELVDDLASSKNLPFSVFKLTGYHSDYHYTLLPNHLTQDTQVQELIDMVTPILDEMLPNRWYYEKLTSDGAANIYLYYPELTMSNSSGATHTIYDMVVALPINSFKILNRISGMRFSFTKEELAVGYTHSHLHSNRIGAFDNFCLGHGDFPTFMTKLIHSSTTTPDEFALLLLQIESYLKWESVEGSPYIQFASIGANRVDDTGHNFPGDIDHTIIERMAEDFIQMLKPEYLTPVSGAGGGYYVNFGLYSNQLYEIEKQLFKKYQGRFSVTGASKRYDESTGTYLRTNASSSSIPSAVKSHYLVSALNIKPRIVASSQAEPDTLVTRLSSGYVARLIEVVNNKLRLGNLLNETN